MKLLFTGLCRKPIGEYPQDFIGPESGNLLHFGVVRAIYPRNGLEYLKHISRGVVEQIQAIIWLTP